MLVRVADAAEAAEAAAAGVDAVELALGGMAGDVDMAGDLAAAHAVRAAFPGILRLRVMGEAPTDIAALAASLRAEVALASEIAPTFETVPGLAAVAVIGAGGDRLAAIQRAKGHVAAVMLEAEPPRRLVDATALAELDAFAFACRAAGLPFGLAGGLEAPDVARLLLLEPDVLGFDVAVRRHHRADSPLDRQALDAIRALVPHGAGGTAPRDPPVIVTDRIFVRDFVTSLSIGAYQAERRASQRVRFSIEADVARAPVPPHDMRDVFSYDVILETIRVLSRREHVTFVETLAEEIAAALLAHAVVTRVAVKVEKLDVVEGSVGIEITRRRGTP